MSRLRLYLWCEHHFALLARIVEEGAGRTLAHLELERGARTRLFGSWEGD